MIGTRRGRLGSVSTGFNPCVGPKGRHVGGTRFVASESFTIPATTLRLRSGPFDPLIGSGTASGSRRAPGYVPPPAGHAE